MSASSGVAAQLMTGEETTYGTAAALDRSYEFVNETMDNQIARIESKGLRAGRRILPTGKWVPGESKIAGDIELEVGTSGFGRWLKHMLGSIATSGVSPAFTYAATPGDLPIGLTVQFAKPSIDGTLQPFTYTGCRINTWELSVKAGELLKLKPTIIGQAESNTVALGTWAEPAGTLLVFTGGTITAGGTQVDLLDFSLKGSNALTERFRVRGAATSKQPLENNWREHTGTMTADFESLTQYNHFLNGDELQLVATFNGPILTGSTHASLIVTANVRYDGKTPTVAGPQLLAQTIPYKVIGPTTDASALSIAYTTSDTAA